VRTEVVKAFLVLKPGFTPGPDLAKDIQEFVKTRLAAHEYPREIEFLPELAPALIVIVRPAATGSAGMSGTGHAGCGMTQIGPS
jgi:acyl-CoA synthetase (AMP-forming)/AMP-acid ligase II